MIKEKTVCFLVKKKNRQITQICLGMKKKGFGKSLYAGIGGKIGDKVQETIEEALVREVSEEIGVNVLNFTRLGKVTFLFPDKEGWGQLVHVFIAEKWEGKPSESKEMLPSWFSLKDTPYEEMWKVKKKKLKVF